MSGPSSPARAAGPGRVYRRGGEVVGVRNQVLDDISRNARVVDPDLLGVRARARAPVELVGNEVGQRASVGVLDRRGPGQRDTLL